MRLKPKSRWGTWVATFAAYLTAFQLVFAAFPAPARTALSGVAAGPLICSRGGVADTIDGSGRPKAPSHGPDCCLFGCAMAGSLLPPSSAAPLPSRAFIAMRITVLRRTDALDVRRERSPRLTRGPPSVG